MNSRLFALAFASLGLLHCTAPSMGNKTSPNSGGDQSTSLGVALTLPTDSEYHTATLRVGQPMVVDVYIQEIGPGTCTDGLLGRSCQDHSYANVTSFDLADVGCDDDLCDVTNITHDEGRASAVITLIPRGTSVTLRASATSGALSGSSELWILPADANSGAVLSVGEASATGRVPYQP